MRDNEFIRGIQLAFFLNFGKIREIKYIQDYRLGYVFPFV
jgi:hypothetical protein